ncbi:MAG TPA: hypothetical protein VI895_07425 [Bdellovibrionota bacterium]|nr:hypothetical protein [Bdellovibrionota bacterium]
MKMTFKEARAALIEALKEGRYQHEARDAQAEKNLLAVGDISPDEVIEILKACRGKLHRKEPHYAKAEIEVHVFKARKKISRWQQWFVRAYFIDEDAWFISVHPAEWEIGK